MLRLKNLAQFPRFARPHSSMASAQLHNPNQKPWMTTTTTDPYQSRLSTEQFSNLSIADTISERPDPTVWKSEPTFNPPKLFSQQELDFYDENGYIVVPNVVSDYRDWREKCVRAMQSKKEEDQHYNEPDDTQTRSIFDVHKNVLRDEFRRYELVGRVQQILGSDVYIHQSRINFQQPFVGTGFYWHSDFETWHSEDGMPRPRSLSCVVMLDDFDPVNGALMVIPGSHKLYMHTMGVTPSSNWEKSLRERQYYGTPSHDQLRFILEEQKRKIVYVRGEAGSIVLFDSNLLHGSQNNLSHMARVGAFGAFNSCENKLVEPFCSSGFVRPDYLAVRESEWTTPVEYSL